MALDPAATAGGLDEQRPVSGAARSFARFSDVVELLGRHARLSRRAEGLHVAEIRDPGSIEPQRVEALCSIMIPVAERILPGNRDWYAWLNAEARRRMFAHRARFFVIGSDTGDIVGWSGCWVVPNVRNRVLLMDMTGLAAEYRGRKIIHRVVYPRLLAERIRHPFGHVYIVGTTRNPTVYHLQVRALGSANVFPRPENGTPAHAKRLAKDVSDWLIPWRELSVLQRIEYDADALILRGGRRDLAPKDAYSRQDPALVAWFDDTLGETDMLLLVSRTTLRHYVTYPLKRRARKRHQRDAAARRAAAEEAHGSQ